jgi:hypothetical protein
MGYYLFAILPNINHGVCALLAVLTILVMLLSIAMIVFIDDRDCDNYKIFIRWSKWLYPVFAFVFLLNMFLPSQKQLAFIIAAPYIVENQQLQEAGKNSAEIIKLGTEYVKDVLTTATTKKGE